MFRVIKTGSEEKKILKFTLFLYKITIVFGYKFINMQCRRKEWGVHPRCLFKSCRNSQSTHGSFR